jgi:hypothetical protein
MVDAITRSPTVPDVEWMWRTYASLVAAIPDFRHLEHQVIWRIAHSDWDYIRQHSRAGIGWSVAGEPPTLWGIEVQLVPPRLGQFPELVIICDRRNA